MPVTEAEAHRDDVRSARRWGRLTVGFVVVLVLVASFYGWRLKVDARDNGIQFDQLAQAFARFEVVTQQQTTLDCNQTSARNEGIKRSWHAFIDNFATPEQQQDPRVVKFFADLETAFPPLVCDQVPGSPVVVPLPSTTVAATTSSVP